MRRTQLYIDDQLWGVLHARARREKTTVSELVRQAVRERYLGSREQRTTAMQRFVGIRKLTPCEPIASHRFGTFVGAPEWRGLGEAVTILVDSDVLIEVSRGRDQAVVSRWIELSTSDTEILFSPVTAAELWAGARPAEFAVLEALFEVLVCVPADAAVGRRAGEYLRRYRKSHSVELGAALIAASAVSSGAMLWTRSYKHYPMAELTFFE